MEDKKKIYIVQGGTGEYENHRRWLYKAYFSEKKAIEAAKELNAKLLALGARAKGMDVFVAWPERVTIIEEMQKIDPQIEIDYLGSNYLVISCELADEDKI